MENYGKSTSYTHCLSNNAITPYRYDISLCLLQPKIVTDAKTGQLVEQAEKKAITYKEHLYIGHMLLKISQTFYQALTLLTPQYSSEIHFVYNLQLLASLPMLPIFYD